MIRFPLLSAAAGLLALAAPCLAQTVPPDAGAPPVVEREIRAQVTARTTTVLASGMAGRIVELAVQDGETFRKGEVLVRFDCAVQESQLARANAVLEKARRLLEVNEKLRQLGSISAKEISVGHAEVAEAGAEVGMMKAMVSRCTVAAPFSGRVAGVSVRQYQFIGEGQPLLDILDDKELELEAIVPSRWLAWLKVGTRFQVVVDENGRSYEGEVSRLSGRVDPVSQSIKLYARIRNPDDRLLAGMSGRAIITPPAGSQP
ncbi:efflux RND transporter periplasmic adaptor subunit [Azospirillum thermophilum]|uniref:efflux RND transporter periplasmic adaptor subunit n=1 Tax=Azospirillum thermophilum TaxID=2202148 RepID=UPI00143CE7C2|nr:efflux RND transporter periplasmic adaptor subunit [Azospirillum thermophilum]